MTDITSRNRALHEIELEAERYRAAEHDTAERQRRTACYPALVAALEAVETATCGQEIPNRYFDGCFVKTDVIRQCAAALALARGKVISAGQTDTEAGQ